LAGLVKYSFQEEVVGGKAIPLPARNELSFSLGHMPRSGLGLYGYLVDVYDLKGIVFKLEGEVK
jgi:hypothetical protein